MKRGVKSNRGQIKISFGMIVSIILVIVFLVFAFYAIKIFLGIQNSAQGGKFVNDFQSDINTVWRSAPSSQHKEYSVSGKIERICFIDFSIPGKGENKNIYDELGRANYGAENLVFYPVGSSNPDSTKIDNINLDEMTSENNPFCIPVVDGKLNLRLEKEVNEALVRVTR